MLSSTAYFSAKPRVPNGVTRLRSKETVSSLRNARGRFPSSFTYFSCRQKENEASQHEKSSRETFFNPATWKIFTLYLWEQTVFAQKSYGENIVFHLFFLFEVWFPDKEIMQTLSSASYLITVWFASNKCQWCTTRRGFADRPHLPLVGDPAGDCSIFF